MAVDFSLPLEASLAAFGEALTLTRVESGTLGTETEPITGILDEGVEPEDRKPGDGSTYALLAVQASLLDPAPQKGDEISTDTAVYKIVDMASDAGDRLIMKLRYDRDVS